MLESETCRFLAIDFDKGNWKNEILAARKIYQEYGIESYMERSRSGNGEHLWVFFSEEIEARTIVYIITENGEDKIKEAMKDADLKTKQKKVSIPQIERFLQRILNGEIEYSAN